MIRSPNRHTLFRRPDHWAAVRQVERLLEGRRVRERTVAAKFRRRMRIDRQSHLQRFVANVRAPDLGPAEEEALLLRKPVDLLRSGLRIFLERLLQRSERDLHSAV